MVGGEEDDGEVAGVAAGKRSLALLVLPDPGAIRLQAPDRPEATRSGIAIAPRG